MVAWGLGSGAHVRGGPRGRLAVVFSLLPVVVTQLCALVKTHQTVQVKGILLRGNYASIRLILKINWHLDFIFQIL